MHEDFPYSENDIKFALRKNLSEMIVCVCLGGNDKNYNCKNLFSGYKIDLGNSEIN